MIKLLNAAGIKVQFIMDLTRKWHHQDISAVIFTQMKSGISYTVYLKPSTTSVYRDWGEALEKALVMYAIPELLKKFKNLKEYM